MEVPIEPNCVETLLQVKSVVDTILGFFASNAKIYSACVTSTIDKMVFVHSSIKILSPAINTFCFVSNANINSASVTSPISEIVFVIPSINIYHLLLVYFVLYLMH